MNETSLPHLETFLVAAECGNFTETASVLSLSQAAVSQRIQQLEMELGVTLFDRRSGRIVLNQVGLVLHEYARRILDLQAEARRKVTGFTREVSGELLLAASTIPGEYILPQIMASFSKLHPKIRTRLFVSDSAVVVNQICKQKAHLGFVGIRNDLPTLECRPFACDHMVVVVPPTPRWSRRKQISMVELTRQSIVQRERGSGSRQYFEDALATLCPQSLPISAAMELGSNEAVKEAVVQGAGVAVLSRLAVQHEITSGRLHALEVNDCHLKRELFVVRSRSQPLPRIAQLFLTYLSSHLSISASS